MIPKPGLTFEAFLRPMRVHIMRPDGLLTFSDVLHPPLPHQIVNFQGDKNNDPVNLAPPYRILKIFIEDMDIADNYADLMLDMNPIARPSDGQLGHFIVRFWCEGAYEKWVCYSGSPTRKLLHHYQDGVLESRTGSFATYDLPKKGKCPVCTTGWV